MIRYEEIHKSKVEFEIHQRYKKEIEELHNLGFSDLQFAREVIFPFSAALLFYVYPLMKIYGEIFRIEKPLRYVLFNPLMLHHEYDSYATIFGMGVKFATLFRDGTVLISTNYPSGQVFRSKQKMLKYGSSKKVGIAEIWAIHQERIVEIEKKGRETVSDLSIDNFESIMKREDRSTWLGL